MSDSFFENERQIGSASLRQTLLVALGFLVGMLVVWAYLVPVDATSVFMSEALPQNLFWLLVGVLAATAAAFSGGLKTSRWELGGAILLLILVVVSTFLAGEVCNPRRAWFGFWQVCSLVAAYYAICFLASYGSATKSALVTLLLAGLIASSVHGVYQVAVEFPDARARYLADPDGEIAKIPGLYAPEGSPQRMRFEDRLLQSREPFANYALANSLGAVLTASLLLLLGMLFQRTGVGSVLWGHVAPDSAEQGRDEKSIGGAGEASGSWLRYPNHRYAIIPLVLCFMVVGCAWFLASSRVAYLAVLVGIALISMLPFISRKFSGEGGALPYRLIAGLFGVLVAIVGGGLWWLGRTDRLVLEEAGKSLGYRLEYWKATWQMVLDHPWLGVGFGNFQAHYPLYKLAQASEEIADPHNWVLDWSASYGLLATLLIVGWLFRFLLRGAFSAHSQTVVGSNSKLDDALAKSLLTGGTLGGLVCVSMLVLLMGMDLWVVVLAWAPAVLATVLLASSIRSLIPFRFVFLSAAVSIGLCLLITGSWQATGIAVPLLLLMALSLERERMAPVARMNPKAQERSSGNSVSDFSMAVGVPMLAVAGLMVFVFQSWMPVTQAWAKQQSAAFSESTVEQEQLAEAARDADTMDADLQGGVAQLAVRKALQSDRRLFPTRAAEAMVELEGWLQLEKTSFAAWRDAGNQVFSLLARASRDDADQSSYGQVVEQYYAKAVQQYPTSAELRVQWAAILAVLGDGERCEKEIQVALRLSENSPHEDKRLGRHRTQGDGDQLVWFPVVPTDRTDLGDSCPVPNMVYAEPLIEWMRKQTEVTLDDRAEADENKMLESRSAETPEPTL
ncbi:MAG: O-antigen ligase family protein [Aureliella sp.]